jgi:hypothetical protein
MLLRSRCWLYWLDCWLRSWGSRCGGLCGWLILFPDNTGEFVLSRSTFSATSCEKFLVVIIMFYELRLFSSHFVSDLVGKFREDVSGSAAVGIGLAHSVAHHGSWHSVGVRISKVAVSKGRTLVSSLWALITLSVDDNLHGSMRRHGSILSTGLHESSDGALLLESVDNF